jgi:hypothetical protein
MSARSHQPHWARRGSWLVATLAAASLIAAACAPTPSVSPAATGEAASMFPSASAGAFVPSFAGADCPDDVSQDILIPVSCGYLTVLENRSSGSGRTVRLLVVKLEPPGGTSTPDPIIILGDVRPGTTLDYGGLAELSHRVHRIEYLMDPRGGGHSEPGLACPEVDAASPALVGLRLRDPHHRAMLLAAVQACHDRLVGQGVDLSAYDFAATAADFRDLRLALGITEWNAQAHGWSEVAFEEAQLYPDGLRSITIDSPTLLEPNFLAAGPKALDLAIERLATDCSATPGCAQRAPDLSRMIEQAVAQLDAKPLVFDVEGTPRAILIGHPIRVVVDGVALLRFIRSELGNERPDGAEVIATVSRVLDGTLGTDDLAVVRLSSDVGDCLGLLPLCDRVNFGTLYSLLCRDGLSSTARSALEADIAGRQAYADLFSPGPLGPACEGWAVAVAPPLDKGPVAGGVPVLILRGAFDPFSATPDQIRTAMGGAPNVYVVEIPNYSSNVLGILECVRSIRNAWVDAPTSAPADTSCLTSIPPLDLGDLRASRTWCVRSRAAPLGPVLRSSDRDPDRDGDTIAGGNVKPARRTGVTSPLPGPRSLQGSSDRCAKTTGDRCLVTFNSSQRWLCRYCSCLSWWRVVPRAQRSAPSRLRHRARSRRLRLHPRLRPP